MDLLADVIATVRGAIVVGLLMVLPGFAIGPYLVPGATTPLAKLGRAIGVGLLTSVGACIVLALAGLLRPTIVATVLAGLTILPLHASRPSWPRFRSRARRWWVGAAGIAAVTGLLVGIPAVVVGEGASHPLAPATWSSVSGALALAMTGGLPVEVPAWGETRSIGVQELPSAAHLAAAVQLLPGDLVSRLVVYRLALTVGGVVVATLLFRRWLSTWPAAAAAGLFVGLVGGSQPLIADPATALPLVLGLFAMWLVDRAVVESSRVLVVTGATVAALILVQRVDVFLIVLAAIVAISLARWLVAPGGGPENAGGLGHRYGRRLGLRLDRRRAAVKPVAVGAMFAIGSVGLGIFASSLLAVVTPSAGVLGTVGTAGPFVGLGEVPPDWRPSNDGAWDFHRASLAFDAGPELPSLDGQAFSSAVATALLAAGAGSPPAPLLVGGMLALSLLAWPTLDQRRQRLMGMLVVFGSLVAVVAFVFAITLEGGWSVRRIGLEGLLRLEWLATAAAITFVAWLAARALVRRTRRPVSGVVMLVVVAGSVVLAGASGAAADRSAAAPSPIAVAAYHSIATETGIHARILANAWTDGVVFALGERSGVIDGRQVDAGGDGLTRATALILGARVVFSDPSSPAARGYLSREGVSHLLVAGPDAVRGDLGGGPLLAVDLAALRSDPGYTLVRSFDDRVFLFEVNPG